MIGAVHSDPAPRARGKSPFVAAVLSLLFPGLGHAYAGAHQRALAFAALPVLALALLAGVVLRADRIQLLGFLLVPGVLPSIFVVNLLFLVYRLIAIIDAYRVTAYINGWRAGRGDVSAVTSNPLRILSLAGLLAVLLVMGVGHAAVARYDALAMTTADCMFDPNRDCTATASGTPIASDSGDPGETPSAEPSISLPPEGTPLPSASAPPWNGTDRLNILLIGADEQQGGHNTDTLIVVSIDPRARQVAMFSLPRDTVDVPLPPGPARNVFGSTYAAKINSFFLRVRNRADIFPGTSRTRGYNGLKAILGNLYGLDIKYFVEVNFNGFVKVVDALGGVTVNVQSPLVDEDYPGPRGRIRVYFPAGVQHMTGDQALIYVRSRHGKFGRGSNDYDRAQRQQRVLLSLREQLNLQTVLPHIDELASALATSVRTDLPRELLPQLLGIADQADTKTIRSYVFSPPRYGREGSQAGLGFVITPYVSRIREAVKQAFASDPALEASRDAVAQEAGRVWVLNGGGSTGQAARIAAYLEYQGLAVSAPARSAPSTAGTTIVVYNGAEDRLPETVKLLQRIFNTTVTTATDPAQTVDIVVTVGRSTPELTPPPAP
jgi:LCP family protein required for cell wall assembly